MMTQEEAQKLIEEGNKTGNFSLVEQGLEAIKLLQQSTVAGTTRHNGDFIAPIERKTSTSGKKACRREPINLKKATAFNLFSDDGQEHAEDKLRPQDKGKWKTTTHGREAIELKAVECASCKKDYQIHPSLYKKPDINPDGTLHNPNICDECIRKKGKR